jgi:hypothetical protein
MSFNSLASSTFRPIVFHTGSKNDNANLFILIMSKKVEKKASYINTKVSDVPKSELLEAIRKVQEQDKLIDDKSRFTSQSLSVRAGR